MVTKTSAVDRWPRVQKVRWQLPRILRRRCPIFYKSLPLQRPPFHRANQLETCEVWIPLQADTSEGLVVAEVSKQAVEFQADDLDRMEMRGNIHENMWFKAAEDFENDFDNMERKMHRFPASLCGLGSRYIVPKVVAIGPYHRGLNHLKEMEKVKQVAVYQFFLKHSTTYEEIHAAFLSVASTARGLYAEDVVAAVGNTEFVDMMIVDGIFLMQYMLMTVDRALLCSSLLHCFHSNQACISNDIMLLENQLPWLVIETLLNKFSFMKGRVELFIAKMGRTLPSPRGQE